MKIFINSLFIICQRFLLLQKRKLWISFIFVKEKRENKKWKEEKEKEREFL